MHLHPFSLSARSQYETLKSIRGHTQGNKLARVAKGVQHSTLFTIRGPTIFMVFFVEFLRHFPWPHRANGPQPRPSFFKSVNCIFEKLLHSVHSAGFRLNRCTQRFSAVDSLLRRECRFGLIGTFVDNRIVFAWLFDNEGNAKKKVKSRSQHSMQQEFVSRLHQKKK